MIQALSVDTQTDLAPFSRQLREAGIPHRIAEQSGRIYVYVEDEADGASARRLYEELRTDGYRTPSEPRAEPRPARAGWAMAALLVRRLPVTLSIVGATIALYPVTSGYDRGVLSGLVSQLAFVEMEVVGGFAYYHRIDPPWVSQEWWRLWTPMFLHFGLIHLVFNLLWLWEIGRRIEMVQNGGVLVLVVAASSLGANLAQYAMTGNALFGGMSGVVFGLLGYSYVWSRGLPSRSTGLPPGIYVFMLVWLALGFTGVIDLLDIGTIANGAHLGGLVSGCGAALVAVAWVRLAASGIDDGWGGNAED